jgi:peptidoglycan hydrolase CwlO-like protein
MLYHYQESLQVADQVTSPFKTMRKRMHKPTLLAMSFALCSSVTALADDASTEAIQSVPSQESAGSHEGQSVTVPSSPVLVVAHPLKAVKHKRPGFMQRVLAPVTELQSQSIGLQEQMTNLKKPIEDLQPAVLKLHERVLGVETQMGGLQQKMGTITDELNTVHDDVSSVSKQITKLEKPIGALNEPVSRIYQPLHAMQEPITRLYQPLSTLGQPISNLRNDMGQLREQMTQLQNPIASLNRPITELQGPLNQLREPVTDLRNELTDLKSQITDLKTAVNRVTYYILVALVLSGLLIAIGLPIVFMMLWSRLSRRIFHPEMGLSAFDRNVLNRKAQNDLTTAGIAEE